MKTAMNPFFRIRREITDRPTLEKLGCASGRKISYSESVGRWIEMPLAYLPGEICPEDLEHDYKLVVVSEDAVIAALS